MKKLTKMVGLTGLLVLLVTMVGGAWAMSGNKSAVTISYSYDDAGRLTAANYGGSLTTGYTYDANGNLIERLSSQPTAVKNSELTQRDTGMMFGWVGLVALMVLTLWLGLGRVKKSLRRELHYTLETRALSELP